MAGKVTTAASTKHAAIPGPNRSAFCAAPFQPASRFSLFCWAVSRATEAENKKTGIFTTNTSSKTAQRHFSFLVLLCNVQCYFSCIFLLCAALTLSPVSVFSPRCTPRRSRRSPRVSSALPPTWLSGPLGSQPRTGKSACRSAPRKPGSWRSK